MQAFFEDLASRVTALQSQNTILMSQMAAAAKMLNAAVIENQVEKLKRVLKLQL